MSQPYYAAGRWSTAIWGRSTDRPGNGDFREDSAISLIFAFSALAMGLLSDAGPPAWHPAPLALRKACQAATEFCRTQGRSLADLALQFALADSPADTTPVGMRTPEEVHLNVATVAAAPDLEFIATLQQRFAPVRNLTWPNGRPENN